MQRGSLRAVVRYPWCVCTQATNFTTDAKDTFRVKHRAIWVSIKVLLKVWKAFCVSNILYVHIIIMISCLSGCSIFNVETSSTVVVTLETERVKVILLSLISLRVLILENQKLVAKKSSPQTVGIYLTRITVLQVN